MTTKKNVLVLTTNDIYDPIRGCDRRSAQLCANLPEEWRVDSISYDKSDTPTDRSAFSLRNDQAGERHVCFQYPSVTALAPFDPRVFSQLRRFDREYDVVLASAVGSVLYGLVASLLHDAMFVVDIHNVDDQLSLEIGNYPRYLFSTVFGTLALSRADLIVLTSDEDAAQFDKTVREKSIVVANGFDSTVFHDDETETSDRILFFGNMGYEPNKEGVELIADSIAPELEARYPDYEIHIAGPNSETVHDLVASNDNVRVVGLVDDIASYIRSSAVVIVPLKTGSGTRLKIIESLACGTRVVSTPKGAEGWPTDWVNLTRTPADSFPECVDVVLSGDEFDMREYDKILSYSWSRQSEKLIDTLEAI